MKVETVRNRRSVTEELRRGIHVGVIMRIDKLDLHSSSARRETVLKRLLRKFGKTSGELLTCYPGKEREVESGSSGRGLNQGASVQTSSALKQCNCSSQIDGSLGH